MTTENLLITHKSYVGIKDKLNIELKQVPRGKSIIDSVYHNI